MSWSLKSVIARLGECVMTKLVFGIFGAGGFGREVMPIARNYLKRKFPNFAPEALELAFIVTCPETDSVNNARIMSEFEFMNLDADEKYFNIALGSSVERENVSNRLLAGGCKPFSVLAESVTMYDQNVIGEGATICDHVTITSNAQIGSYFQANIYSYVAHDCRLGNFVTFAPRVSCNGNVVIEDYAYIGTGATLKQGSAEKPLVIGKGAVVGMGAVVTKDVPAYTVVVGNPARPMKQRL